MFIFRCRLPVVLALVSLVSAGCGTSTYQVKVDSISKPPAEGEPQSFTLKSKDPRLGPESLRYLEAAEFVRTALSGKGYYEAPNNDSADMVVELEFGMQTPRAKTLSVSTPVYAQVGGGVRYDTVPITDAKGVTTTRTVAVYEQPQSELVGYRDAPQSVGIYEKYLRLTARENKPAVEGQPPAELWSVQVSAEDESKDLRKYLPIMASASIDYIGKDSANAQKVKVKEDSEGVEFIKRGMGGGQSATLAVKATGAQPKPE